jgi:hypothetical protein
MDNVRFLQIHFVKLILKNSMEGVFQETVSTHSFVKCFKWYSA